MKKIILVLVVLWAAGAIAMLSYGSTKKKAPRNVVLIGWDGADRRNIKQYMAAGELANLKKLASEGAMVAVDILRATDTKAGWAQILTGYNPEKTGVWDNWRYGPIPKGYTVFERLENHFGCDKFATVAVVAKSNNVDADPPSCKPIGKKALQKMDKKAEKQIYNEMIGETEYKEIGADIVEKDGKLCKKEPGKPYFQTVKSMDVFINGLMQDRLVGEKAIELLEQYRDKRFLFFVHFAEIDHKGHHMGEGSKKQHGAYLSADKWLGEIVGKLKELGLYDETTVYVTSDHGFDKGKKRHKDAPYVFLATNDSDVMRRGERADIAPTILERFGLDPGSFDPPLDGHTLTKPHTPPLW